MRPSTHSSPLVFLSAFILFLAAALATLAQESGCKNPRGNSAGLVGGADALATFRVTYASTGQPVTSLHPAAWLSANTSGRAPSEIECKDTIRTFLGGLLSVRPEVDLNGYTMLTLNHDNTITFINPQIASKVTKLEAIIELPGTGADWALSADKNFLYVT